MLFCVASGTINTGDNISVLSADYNNIVVYIPLAIIGSISFIFIFVLFKDRKTIEFLFKNTIFFMAVHYYYLYEWMKIYIKGNVTNLLVGLMVAVIISLFCILYRYLITYYNIGRLENCMNYIGLYVK